MSPRVVLRAGRTRALALLVLCTVAACTSEEKKEQQQVAAAARRAQQVAPPATAEHPPSTTIHLAAGGKQPFSGAMTDRASCTFQESAGDRLVQLEGIARDAQLSFVLMNPSDGAVKVADLGKQHRGLKRVTNLEVTVHGRHYAGGRGSGTVSDPAGRTGSLAATVYETARHRHTPLSVKITWQCE